MGISVPGRMQGQGGSHPRRRPRAKRVHGSWLSTVWGFAGVCTVKASGFRLQGSCVQGLRFFDGWRGSGARHRPKTA
eukprot:3723413-Rhodomonas_salina.3